MLTLTKKCQTKERKDLKIKCECRKPGIKLFQDAIEKHNIDISNSYFISDTVKDLEVTNMIKITPLLVMTGYGKMQVLNDKKISIKGKKLHH